MQRIKINRCYSNPVQRHLAKIDYILFSDAGILKRRGDFILYFDSVLLNLGRNIILFCTLTMVARVMYMFTIWSKAALDHIISSSIVV